MALEIIDYLKGDVRQSIIDDVKEVAEFHKLKTKGGFFSIPRQVFCYVDYLGALAYGKNSSLNSIKFMKEFFPSNYKKFGELIYTMWCHGTVHTYAPKRLYIKDDRLTLIAISWRSTKRTENDAVESHLHICSKQGNKRDLYLNINIYQLVDDLLNGLDAFIDFISKDKIREDRADKVQYELEAIRSCEDQIQSPKIRREVKRQIREAFDSVTFDMDSKGELLKI